MRFNRFGLFVIFVFLGIVCITFPFLVSTKLISGGDYTPSSQVIIGFVSNFWSWCNYSGLGFNCAAINLHSTPIWLLAAFLSNMSLPTFLLERILWWIPFFVGGFLSITILFKKIFSKNNFWMMAPFVFIFNTYILMIISGGQITGIGLGYSFTPLFFWSFIQSLEKYSIRRIVSSGLLLTFLVIVDPRIAFIAYLGCCLYALSLFFWNRHFTVKELVKIILMLLAPIFIAVCLHFYWILPAIIVHQNPLVQLGPAYSTTGAASYFSFATFENALGLLHPNWPENIFGLTHFMKSEFLLLPILAFSSLFFINRKRSAENIIQNKENFYVLFFVLLALVGIFLAKGAQEPFGNVYLWLFSHVPGFQLFRDPTKWYMLIAISYSLLIPFTLQNLSDLFRKRGGRNIRKILYFSVGAIFVVYFAWTIKPLFQHALGGVFVSTQEPGEYKQLSAFLSSQPEFFRTLWIPSEQRFGLYSVNHPVISLPIIFPKLKNISELEKHKTLIQEMGIRYIIVPYDSEKEIYLTDRKFDDERYKKILSEVKKVPWLIEKKSFGKLTIFEVPDAKDRFFTQSNSKKISYKIKDPTEYSLEIKDGKKGDRIVFSNTFDSNWQLNENEKIQNSQPFNKLFNSFILPNDGDQRVEIVYGPQQWVSAGAIISSIALTALIVLLFRIK